MPGSPDALQAGDKMYIQRLGPYEDWTLTIGENNNSAMMTGIDMSQMNNFQLISGQPITIDIVWMPSAQTLYSLEKVVE